MAVHLVANSLWTCTTTSTIWHSGCNQPPTTLACTFVALVRITLWYVCSYNIVTNSSWNNLFLSNSTDNDSTKLEHPDSDTALGYEYTLANRPAHSTISADYLLRRELAGVHPHTFIVIVSTTESNHTLIAGIHFAEVII